MKAKERILARKLRGRGLSVREISLRIKCAKSSVSEWVRDIALNDKQISRLKLNQDRGRAKAANHPNSPKLVWYNIRNGLINAASKEIPGKYLKQELKIVGTALYWAEGYKAGVNLVSFSNADPDMIMLMMKFFREICLVPEWKFRAGLQIHPHLDCKKALMYWSKVSGIPGAQFHKVNFAVSKASKHKRDTLPLGTFRIVVCDTRLQSRLKGWINGLKLWAVGAIG